MRETWEPETVAAPQHLGLRGRAFRLLLLATVGSFCGYMLLLPVVPLWAVRGGAGEFGAGATTAAYMLTTVLVQLAMPWLLARGGYRWTFAVGSLLLGVPAPAFALTTDLGPLLAISAVRGVGFGMVSVVAAALAARLVPTEQIGRAAGYYGLAVGLPNVALLSGGVWLALNVGFGPVFWIAGIASVLGAAGAVAVWRTSGAGYDPRTDGTATADGHEPAEPIGQTNPRPWAALAGPLVLMLALAVASTTVVTFVAIPLERAAVVATGALLAYSVAMVLVRWLAGTLSDRSGRPVLLVPGTVTAAAGAALLAWGIWPSHDGWSGPDVVAGGLIVTGAALFGAGFGGAQNDSIVAMFQRAGRSGYGTASAVWNMGYDAGTGVGAVSVGLLAQQLGYGPAFLAAAAMVACCFPVSVLLARERPGVRQR